MVAVGDIISDCHPTKGILGRSVFVLSGFSEYIHCNSGALAGEARLRSTMGK